MGRGGCIAELVLLGRLDLGAGRGLAEAARGHELLYEGEEDAAG